MKVARIEADMRILKLQVNCLMHNMFLVISFCSQVVMVFIIIVKMSSCGIGAQVGVLADYWLGDPCSQSGDLASNPAASVPPIFFFLAWEPLLAIGQNWCCLMSHDLDV